jgi:hemoglobin
MRTLLLAVAIASAACATSKPAETKTDGAGGSPAASNANKSLYDRLGGKPAVEAVVDEFLARIAADERVNASFAGANLPKLRQRLVELVCVGTGGPCTYSGRDMKTAHAGMGVTNAQWDALAGHFVGALDKFKVPEKEKNELLAIVVPMKKDIVEEP